MNDLLRQALFPTNMNTGGQTQVTKNALTEFSKVAAQVAELEPPKPLSNDDEVFAVLVTQQFLEKLIKEKQDIHCCDTSFPNGKVVSVIYGLKIIVVSFVKDFKIITNKEYKLIYKALINI